MHIAQTWITYKFLLIWWPALKVKPSIQATQGYHPNVDNIVFSGPESGLYGLITMEKVCLIICALLFCNALSPATVMKQSALYAFSYYLLSWYLWGQERSTNCTCSQIWDNEFPNIPKILLSSAGAWPFLQSSQLKALNNKCRYRMLCARAQGAQGYHAPLSAVLLQAYTTEAVTQFIDKAWMNP